MIHDEMSSLYASEWNQKSTFQIPFLLMEPKVDWPDSFFLQVYSYALPIPVVMDKNGIGKVHSRFHCYALLPQSVYCMFSSFGDWIGNRWKKLSVILIKGKNRNSHEFLLCFVELQTEFSLAFGVRF